MLTAFTSNSWLSSKGIVTQTVHILIEDAILIMSEMIITVYNVTCLRLAFHTVSTGARDPFLIPVEELFYQCTDVAKFMYSLQ